jgi:hypothetical protein
MGATFVQAQSVKDLNLLVNQLTFEKNFKKALEPAQKAVQLAEKEAIPNDIDYFKNMISATRMFCYSFLIKNIIRIKQKLRS